MKQTWSKIQKALLAYQRSDRNALLILSAILIISIVANYLVQSCDVDSPQDFSEMKALIDNWEKTLKKNKEESKPRLYAFDPNTATLRELDSLTIPNAIKRNIVNYRKAGGTFKSASDLRKIYGMNDSIFTRIKPYILLPKEKMEVVTAKRVSKTKLVQFEPTGVFDPNSATQAELESFGFNNFQRMNILKYRELGGKFNSKQDLKKIYGVDSAFFMGVEKFIDIKQIKEVKEIKRPVLNIVELNSADTVELMNLPGIGKIYAQRIVKYRNLLGGYYSKKQLLEVYNFKEETYTEISEKITADTLLLKKLRINFLDFKGLVKHPYLEKEHVLAILRQRDEFGPFNSVSELKKINAFNQKEIQRISPYITCR